MGQTKTDRQTEQKKERKEPTEGQGGESPNKCSGQVGIDLEQTVGHKLVTLAATVWAVSVCSCWHYTRTATAAAGTNKMLLPSL